MRGPNVKSNTLSEKRSADDDGKSSTSIMPAKHHILVVEDNDMILKLILHLLSNTFNVQTESIQNGMEALDYIKNNAPDVIILDLMLPGKSGFDILKELDKSGHREKLKIILLSAKSRAEDIERGFELKADEYITKPFQPKEFIARVKKVLNSIT